MLLRPESGLYGWRKTDCRLQIKDGAAAGGKVSTGKYESTLKALDARLYSAVGAAGELFAVRNELFEAMEPDTLLDDFILSLRITMKGARLLYCTNAYAIESGSADMREEENGKCASLQEGCSLSGGSVRC